jgi:hypothetical protein
MCRLLRWAGPTVAHRKIHVLTHTVHDGCGALKGVRADNTPNGSAWCDDR